MCRGSSFKLRHKQKHRLHRPNPSESRETRFLGPQLFDNRVSWNPTTSHFSPQPIACHQFDRPDDQLTSPDLIYTLFQSYWDPSDHGARSLIEASPVLALTKCGGDAVFESDDMRQCRAIHYPLCHLHLVQRIMSLSTNIIAISGSR